MNYQIYCDSSQVAIFYFCVAAWLSALLIKMRRSNLFSTASLWIAIGSLCGAPILFLLKFGITPHEPHSISSILLVSSSLYVVMLVASLLPFGGSAALFCWVFGGKSVTVAGCGKHLTEASPELTNEISATTHPIVKCALALGMGASALLWVLVLLNSIRT